MAMALSSSSSCPSPTNRGGGTATVDMTNRLVPPSSRSFAAKGIGRKAAAAAVTHCSNQRPQVEGRGEDGVGTALDFARLSSDDLSYLWNLAAGSFGGASAIKYGIVLFPDITKPNIIQALLMVSLPVLVAIVILVKGSSMGSESEDLV